MRNIGMIGKTSVRMPSPCAVLFVTVVLLAIALRLIGIRWGLPQDSWPHPPFHPDERWAIDTMQSLDLLAGKFTSGGSREGSLSFYIWHLILVVGQFFGLLSVHFKPNVYDGQAAAILLVGRLSTAAFGVLSVILTYKIVAKVTACRASALFAAALLAIAPFEVIYSHYMRQHVPADFFMLALLYASLFVYERPTKGFFALLGLLAALLAATRYPFVFVIGVPLLYWLIGELDGKRRASTASPNMLRDRIRGLLTDLRPYILIIVMIATFLVLNPFLFLDYATFKTHLAEQASYVNQQEFSGWALFDLGKTLQHITYLMPYGLLPTLWIVMYLGVVYALFLRQYWKYTLPIVVVFSPYFLFITKAYPFGFIRGVMFVIPLMAIFSGIAASHLAGHSNKFLKASLAAMALLLCGLSGLYTWAYVTAMGRADPREQVHAYFARLAAPPPELVTCYWKNTHSDFSLVPGIAWMGPAGFQVVEVPDIRTPPPTCTYLLIPAFEYTQKAAVANLVKFLNQASSFRTIEIFENPIRISGIFFNYPRNPHDLLYPFPIIYLLRNQAGRT